MSMCLCVNVCVGSFLQPETEELISGAGILGTGSAQLPTFQVSRSVGKHSKSAALGMGSRTLGIKQFYETS